MNNLLICVAGKNNIAVDVLKHLICISNGRYDLCVVCNKTDKGVNSFQRSLRLYAGQNNITECELEDLYGKRELIFLSLEFDKIINTDLFKSDRLFNIHFSLLPKYKGMYTSAIPILYGEKTTGVTFHRIDNGIDTGNIIAQKEFIIENNDTCRDIYLKYIKYGTETVIGNIENIISNCFISKEQPSDNSSYFSKKAIDYADLKIDLKQTAAGIQNQIRAYSFREYQMPEIEGRKIIDSKITNIRSAQRCGTVLAKSENEFMITTIDYNIILYVDRFDELMIYCKTGNLEAVKTICAVPRHINEYDSNGWTPLIVATYNNQIDIVKHLILHGADIYAKNYNGINLLMYAKDAYKNTGDNTLFKLFKCLGLNENDEDYSGKCLLDYMAEDNIGIDEILNNE